MAGEVRLTRSELSLLDRLASEEYGLPSCVLMENAGRGAADRVLELLAESGPWTSAGARVAVLAGPGKNGGDACVLARHVANAGVAVEVLATRGLEDLRGDSAMMRAAIERMRIPVVRVGPGEAGLGRAVEVLQASAVIVDGLPGTGFRGPMRPELVRLVQAANAAHAQGRITVALDLPSGLDADTGEPAEPTLVADHTVTFAAWKRGFDSPRAKPFLGKVRLATIGTPGELLGRVLATRG